MKHIFTLILIGLLCSQIQAQTIVPTQTDEIIIDNGASGKADPNDRIRYKVTIQNTGGADGTGAQLNIVPDPRTTLVPGSFRSSPLAVPDAYTCTGNVGLAVPAAAGVKANDFDDNLAMATVTAGAFATTQSGSIMLNANGSFIYSPPAGFTGVDTYVYTLNDANGVGGPVPTTDMATITITVSNMIWFVDNSVAGPGTGTVSDPFKILTGAATASAVGHVIFVKNTGTAYNTGITLKNNQWLLGSGHSGGTNLADAGVLPFAVAPNSKVLPVINDTRPLITSPSNGITLASGNTIRGLGVGRCVVTKIFGSGFGTLTIGNTTNPDVSLSGNRSALDLTNGTFAASSKFINITSGDSSTTAILLNNVSGSLASGNTTIVQSSSGGISIDIQNSSAALDFGVTTIIKQTSSGNVAVTITNSGTGSVTFSSLAITCTSFSTGLLASMGGTINIGGATNTISTSNAAALDITNTSFGSGATFSNIMVSGNPAKGVNLDNVSGPLMISNGSINLSVSGGIGFDINAGASTITYAGTMSYLGPSRVIEVTGRTGGSVIFSGNLIVFSGTGINVSGNTAGMITFNGASKSLTTGANTAITLAGNTGAIVGFTNGGLVVSTTSGTGYDATGGGVITVSGTGNTITSTTGTALNVANTTISSSNLTFERISANGASNGIVLNTTGLSGGLIVTGTGTTDGSGGTIQNITNRGVSATSTANLSLKNMTFTNANTTDASPCGAADNSGCNAAIYINSSTNATLDNVDINGTQQQGINLRELNGFQLLNSTVINGGAGGQTEEADLYALNLFGTCAITSSSLTVPAERAAVIYNTSKTLGLTVTGSTFGMNQTQPLGADGLEVNNYGTSNLTLSIVNSTFIQPKTNGLQVISEGSSFSRVDITGSTFDPGAGLAAAIDLDVNNTATMQFNITNNPLIKSRGINAINIFGNFVGANASFEGRINNNPSIVSAAGSGVGVRVIGLGNNNHKVEIKNNTITSGTDNGIDVIMQGGTGRMDATVTGNNITVGANGGYAIGVAAGVSSSTFNNKVCANVANNITSLGAGAIGNYRGRAATMLHELLSQGGGTTVPTNWDMNTNSPLSTAPGANVVQSGAGIFTFGATCLIPTF